MAVPMDSTSELSSRERVQRLYNKNVELETRRHRSVQARIPSDANVWQQMRENYEAIILEDHAFAEQHELEYELWQLHYKRIEELRAHFSAAVASTGVSTPQSGKSNAARPDRVAKIRSQFKTFLSEATGFYHELMLKIRAKYGLPLGYFSDNPSKQIVLSKHGNRSADLEKGLISCHSCLIYLGDLARYKGLYGEGESKTRDFAASSSYYMQASSLWPLNGNPHHQLAILASYFGDEFVAVYRYFRSLAVESPFLTARDNLIIAFEKNRQNYSQLLGDLKASLPKAVTLQSRKGRGKGEARLLPKDTKGEASLIKERACSIPETLKAFSVKFVRLNGILFTRTSLETFGDVLSMARSDFLELLFTGSEEEYNLGSDATESGLFIVRLVTILIFTVHNVNRESENQSYAEILQRSVLLQHAYTAVFEFMGHILERCIQLQDPLSSFLLPGVLIFVEWLASHPDIAAGKDTEEKQANVRSFFWSNCISFFNKLLLSGFISVDEDETCFFNMSRYDEGETANQLALWEDLELRGFLPLHPAQQILDFSGNFGNDGGNKEKKARVQRIIGAGKAFANVVWLGQQALYFDPTLKKFFIGAKPQMSCDLVISSHPEMPMTNGASQDLSSTKKNVDQGIKQPVPQLLIDGEDEEEEIVFKPSVADKRTESTNLVLTSCEVPGTVHNVSRTALGVCAGSVSVPPDAVLVQNIFDTTSRPPTFLLNATAQHVQPIQASTSNCLVEQQASVLNGFNKLNLMENGDSVNLKPQEHFGPLQHAVLSLPFPGPPILGAESLYLAQVSETGAFSKSNPVMSSGIGSMPMLPITSRKNPVSRPVRHIGPPPGFTPVPPKHADELMPGLTMKDDNPLMDDYSWLDGYQMPSSNPGIGFDIPTNRSGQTVNTVGKISSMTGMITFPFPGKQASVLKDPVGNHSIWKDCQFPEHLQLYQEQKPQMLQKGNQPPMPLPEQHRGQSLWEGHLLA
ncbi:hypothetical protein Ancab_013900 [Ancistrocladus abbreviatus]